MYTGVITFLYTFMPEFGLSAALIVDPVISCFRQQSYYRVLPGAPAAFSRPARLPRIPPAQALSEFLLYRQKLRQCTPPHKIRTGGKGCPLAELCGYLLLPLFVQLRYITYLYSTIQNKTKQNKTIFKTLKLQL